MKLGGNISGTGVNVSILHILGKINCSPLSCFILKEDSFAGLW